MVSYLATEQEPKRRLSDRKERVADIIANVLVDAGVETIFGVPGGPIAPLNDALMDQPSVRYVTTKHENGALFAAAGYARIRGELGVAVVTSGPGILNALTGLASAFCDGLPVLVLVGEVPREIQGKGALQDGSAHALSILSITRPITKFAVEVPDVNAAATTILRAMRTAVSGKPGPVVVTVPMDLLTGLAHTSEVSMGMQTHFALHPRLLDKIVNALHYSKRTVIFAGSGCRAGAGPAELVALAERLDCPVMTTPKGKGVFPETHRLSLGVFGLGGHPSTRNYLVDGVETVLAIGTSLGDLATDGWSELLAPTRAFIHVDIDAVQIGKRYAAQITVAAPADCFMAEVCKRLPARRDQSEYGVTHHTDPDHTTNGPQGLIAPQRAVWEIQQVMPEDTIYVIDSGEHYFFATHYLRIDRPDSYLVMTGLGSMGSSFGGSIGARFARPERPVAVICGDGGFAMAGTEIITAAAEGLPIVYFVFNDERLGMVENGNLCVYGRTPSYTTGPLNVVRFGRSVGARSMAAWNAGDILNAQTLRSLEQGPVVVDVHIDSTVQMPKNRRFAALAAVANSEA